MITWQFCQHLQCHTQTAASPVLGELLEQAGPVAGHKASPPDLPQQKAGKASCVHGLPQQCCMFGVPLAMPCVCQGLELRGWFATQVRAVLVCLMPPIQLP